MIKFAESIDINANAARVFDYTQDYRHRLEWDTFLIQAYLLDNATVPEKGVKAWCVARNGLGMETVYVSFNRPRVAAIKMTRGPCMFRDFAASWSFAETGGGSTRVTFTYSFRLRFPYNLVPCMVRAVLRRNVRQRLVDLKARFA